MLLKYNIKLYLSECLSLSFKAMGKKKEETADRRFAIVALSQNSYVTFKMRRIMTVQLWTEGAALHPFDSVLLDTQIEVAKTAVSDIRRLSCYMLKALPVCVRVYVFLF